MGISVFLRTLACAWVITTIFYFEVQLLGGNYGLQLLSRTRMDLLTSLRARCVWLAVFSLSASNLTLWDVQRPLAEGSARPLGPALDILKSVFVAFPWLALMVTIGLSLSRRSLKTF